MKGIRAKINHSDINRFRFHFQIAAFVTLLYGGYLALDISTYTPTFVCPYAGKTGGTCYLMPLQHQVNLPWTQFLSGRGMGLLTGFLTFLLLFVLFNKSWCGFFCPLGTLQDWITKARTKLGVRYSSYSEGARRKLGWIKYALLILLILIPLGMSNSLFGMPVLSHEFATPYCMICPARTLLPIFSGDLSQLAVDFSSKPKMALTGLGMAISGVFLAGAFVKKRFFCLYCPMSAFQYLFSRLGFLRLEKNGAGCTRCGNCLRACDMDIRAIADDVESRNIVKDDCMMCFKCVGVCPEQGCLKVRYLGITLYEATPEGFFRRMENKNAAGDP